MLHIPPTNSLLLAAKREPYKKKKKKAYLVTKNIKEFSGIKFRRKGQAGRKTRQEIAKWNQMTAQRFQTGENIRHSQPPFGVMMKKSRARRVRAIAAVIIIIIITNVITRIRIITTAFSRHLSPWRCVFRRHDPLPYRHPGAVSTPLSCPQSTLYGAVVRT